MQMWFRDGRRRRGGDRRRRHLLLLPILAMSHPKKRAKMSIGRSVGRSGERRREQVQWTDGRDGRKKRVEKIAALKGTEGERREGGLLTEKKRGRVKGVE